MDGLRSSLPRDTAEEQKSALILGRPWCLGSGTGVGTAVAPGCSSLWGLPLAGCTAAWPRRPECCSRGLWVISVLFAPSWGRRVSKSHGAGRPLPGVCWAPSAVAATVACPLPGWLTTQGCARVAPAQPSCRPSGPLSPLCPAAWFLGRPYCLSLGGGSTDGFIQLPPAVTLRLADQLPT